MLISYRDYTMDCYHGKVRMDSPIALTTWMPLLLVVIGFLVGGYGTMAGIGGGVVLLPLLMMLFPQAEPGLLTAVSLAIVFLNASSGALAYARQRRIDYKNGILFAMATIPATVLGVWVLRFISIKLFSILFAVLLLAVALFILLRPQERKSRSLPDAGKNTCRIMDSHGEVFTYTFNRYVGMGLSSVVGFIAGFMGIGGGVIHVPLMVYVLCIPVHIATATSHFILIFTALSGVISHLAMGTYQQNWPVVFWLALGIIPGSQLGAWLSHRIHGTLIVRLLALALIILGVRLLFKA
jgi:uncharacterized membrane protein YfcA